ncbi:hypothetical protein EV215_1804 [Hypnocyclicus thermotrophus]|uniref:Flagellar hook-length control protein FliK n=1 Tax=Hypnocyclicus thermotrophus TaxID=1627895 RepID=A0AA46DXG5_9FUSO|nr:hypothetical protein [Hypnocyclicus thermotrophus]TDT68083.1 hypothetical protein EV215_1804 [Hypnocyclicus thermotrophus]
MFKFIEQIANKIIDKQDITHLKPGMIVNARVLNNNKNSVILYMNGIKIEAKSNKNIKINSVVKLKIVDIKNNEIFVKIIDENNVEFINKIKTDIDIQKEFMTILVKEKIFLKSDEIKKLVKKYGLFSKEKQDIYLQKSLIIANELNELNNNDKIELLRKYFLYENGKLEIKKIDINKKLFENLKKEYSNFKINNEELYKACKSYNEYSQKYNYLVYMFGLKTINKPIIIKEKINLKNKEEKEVNKEFIIIIEFEKLGKIKLELVIKNKNIYINFEFEKMLSKSEILKKIEITKEKLKKIGYNLIVKDIFIKIDSIQKIDNLNLKG